MEIVKIDLNNIEQQIVEKVANVIKNGGVVVVPTDTIYGLICDATQEASIRKIFDIKKRDANKPIGIFVGDISMAKNYATIKKDHESLLESADTFILPLAKELPFQKEKIGVRISQSQIILEVIKILGLPLAQTSANISGNQSTNNIDSIIKDFSESESLPDLVITAGNLLHKAPSRVVDLTTEKPIILRG
jgi:L-threonylcarbamoyladenylate synthase